MPPAQVSKKTKLAKGRLDTFYHLAKEHGFRSRASFKLIQLNKKYGFLDNAVSLVDLCAAPGGWLQVAQKHMPSNSVIIGVDLQEIRPIRGVISFTDDITKPSCIRTIQQHLKSSKVDVVLHDGAPNMGTAWGQDAYSQVDLTLKATSCATKVLKKGGWYITKVFRSEDYNSLLWVFNQMFQKVEATKPMASRATSAEIYVVCKGFLAPAKLDPKLLDSRHVFKQDEQEKKVTLNVITKGKKNREGYSTTGPLLYKKINIMDFMNSDDPVQTLAQTSTFEFVGEEAQKVFNHVSTTPIIKAACQDLKVLGKNDFKSLLKWRQFVRSKVLDQEEETEAEKKKKEKDEKDSLELQQALLSKREKRERKKELMRKRKSVKKIQLKMAQTGDNIVDGDQLFQLTNLDGMTDKDLTELAEDAKMTEEMFEHLSEEDDVDEVIWSDDEDNDSDLDEEQGKALNIDKMEADMNWQYELYLAERKKRNRKTLPTVVEKDKFKRDEVKGDHVYESDEEDKEMLAEADDESDQVLKTSKKNLLLVEETSLPKQKKVDQWFAQDLFSGMEDFDVEQAAIGAAPKRKSSEQKEEPSNKRAKKEAPAPSSPTPDQVVPDAKQANGKKQAKEKQANGKLTNGKTQANGIEAANGKAAVENGKQNGKEKKKEEKKKEEKKKADKSKRNKKDDEFEVVPEEPDMDSDNEAYRDGVVADEDSLDEGDNVSDDETDIGRKVQTLAIATNMLRKKARMTIEDDMFNRYTFNDEGLPDWFVKHEERYIQPNLPITKEQVQEMRRRYQEINNRPIKKVAEALARKKRRNTVKTTKAKEKAHAIAQDESLTPGQKISQVNKIMKKANQKQGREKVYVVAKKGSVGGMKKKRKHVNHARVKMVDSRMKKEARANKRSEKEGRKGGRKGGAKKGGGKPKGRKGK